MVAPYIFYIMKILPYVAVSVVSLSLGIALALLFKPKKEIVYVPVKDYSLESKKDSIAREVIAMPLDSVVDWFDGYLSK